MADLLAGFPVVVEIPVAWGDMDAFRHVNNTVYLKWFETARIAWFQAVGWLGAEGPGPILARTSCAFRLPVTFPDTVRVGVRADDVGEDRLTHVYRVVSARHGAIAAEGDGRVVSFDYERGAKAPLPAAVRGAMLRLG